MSTELPSDFPKDLLSRYDEIRYIARGGMGVLFCAHDKTLDKLVAIKALPSGNLLGNEKVVRFQKEAKAAGVLDHPNIVKVLDFGVTPSGDPYLIMDFVDGPSLADEITINGPIELITALRYFVEIADGLAHAHRHGVIHRDVKPSNVMLAHADEFEKEARIVDFGVAHMRRVDSDDPGFESTGGNIIGSPGYVSPEVVSGGKADQRSDVYSLGCLMFETLTGQLPFVTDTAMQTMAAHVNNAPPEISDFLLDEGNQELASALSEIVMKCLNKDPANRFKNADELKAALIECAGFIEEEQRASITEHVTAPGGIFKSWSFNSPAHTKTPMLFAGIAILIPVGLMFWIGPSMLAELRGERNVKQTKMGTELKFKDGTSTTYSQFLGAINPDGDIGSMLEITSKNLPKFWNPRRKLAKLSYATIADDAMKKLETYPVYHLEIRQSKISPKALQSIGKLKNLNDLKLELIDELTDDDLRFLTGLKELSSLSLKGTKITDGTLETCSTMTSLQELSIEGCQKITASGIRLLKNAVQLTNLSIGATKVPVSELKGFDHLRELSVQFKKLTPTDVETLASLKELRGLTVTGCNFGKAELYKFLDSKFLQDVKAATTALTEEDARAFEKDYLERQHRPITIQTTYPYTY